jgi:3-oxoacyl-[acyl-carrier-protein] synthase II
MARFAQYAMVASEEALDDAGWLPEKETDLEATVRWHHPLSYHR